MAFTLLYRDEDYVVIHKPAGFAVHPPEDRRLRRLYPKSQVVLPLLRDQINRYVYPLHRLDVATEGVLAFALSSEAARIGQSQFSEHRVRKLYWLICRGWIEDSAVIDRPLERDSNQTLAPAATRYRCLHRIEIASSFYTKFPTVRYAWAEAEPQTGRYHQIRRHFNRISHPIIGDNDHGDSKHNRFFRDEFGIAGLCLLARHLTFYNRAGEKVAIESSLPDKWVALRKLFQSHEGAQHAAPASLPTSL